MALTKEQIYEAMRTDILKRKRSTPKEPHKPKPDNFSDLVTKLKDKKKSD